MINLNAASYQTEGYLVARGILGQDVLAPYTRSLDQMIAALKEDERPENLKEPHVNARDWQDWLELCRHPKILKVVRGILGEDLVLLMSHLIVKRAKDGKKVQWHQDNTYWASVEGTDICTVWLALDRADPVNGCMRVIPNSHEGFHALEMTKADDDNLLAVKIDVTPELESSAVDVILDPGDLSVHDSFIIHGSNANTSERRRAGYPMRYANASTVKVDVENHGKPVYFVSGDDRWLKPGMRDIRSGKQLPEHPGVHISGNATKSLLKAKPGD